MEVNRFDVFLVLGALPSAACMVIAKIIWTVRAAGAYSTCIESDK